LISPESSGTLSQDRENEAMTAVRRRPWTKRAERALRACAASMLLCVLIALTGGQEAAATDEPQALRGVALVVGNGDYEALPRLANPAADADAVETLLADLGFDSVRRTDRDARSLARDLERFVEDAADADVAVFYYAGHGIEAGGENWLVPIDADLAALEDAGERLVPVSAILDRLRRTVPVTILLLDACRDNPFPPGAVLRADPRSEAAPVSSTGLGETRGARALSNAGEPASDTLGMVIGFAAEPGRPALDGAAGGHSPYAAALIRHVDAMAGEEFGTVMRMVAEEVYLKTGGRQRPWVNESLRRLLYLGEAPPEREAAEQAVLGERRRLLVTIAALPDPQRARAESLARAGDVPMSVVYAMLQAAGIDPSDDPQTVEARLKAEIDRFAEARRDRQALRDPDPDIQRLTLLADEAELEGALNAANGFRDQAKARVAALRSTRQDQLQALRQRFLEDADVYVRSAETKKLLFRFDEAAQDYGEARLIAAEVDPARATRLLGEEIGALLVHGEVTGSPAALDRAGMLARQALAGTPRGMADGDAATFRHRLAAVLMLQASRRGELAPLIEARDLLRQAEEADGGLAAPVQARIALDHGRAIGEIALREGRLPALAEAEAAFERAALIAGPAGDTALEAEARFRQLQALFFRWSATGDQALVGEMIARLTAMMAIVDATDDAADVLAVRYVARATQIGFDIALRWNTPEALSAAGEIAGLAAGIFDPARFPLISAEIGTITGRIAYEWAERFGDASGLAQAATMQRAALETFREAEAAAFARETRWHLAATLVAIGRREAGDEALEEALALLDGLSAEPSVAANPALARQIAFQQARARAIVARKGGDAATLRAAADRLDALGATIPADDAAIRAALDLELGRARAAVGLSAGDLGALRAGTDLLAAAVAAWEQAGSREANRMPFLELYDDYARAAGFLALETGDREEMRRAIAVQDDLLSLYGEAGHAFGRAVAANGLAYLLMSAARIEFDADGLARAAALVEEARGGVALWPDLAGFVENTRCEIDTLRAGHDRDLAGAKAALERCREGLRLLTEAGQTGAVATARESVARAERLAADLAR
jgi:uncharacterized caspase-like protein